MNRRLPLLIVFLLPVFVLGQELQDAIQKFKSFKTLHFIDHVKYTDIFSQEINTDTINGYFDYSSKDSLIQVKMPRYEAWRDTEKLISIQVPYKTYAIKEPSYLSPTIWNSLPNLMVKLENELKKAKEVKLEKDSAINGQAYKSYLITVFDSLDREKRVFKQTKILIDKNSSLPVFIRMRSEGFLDNSDLHVTYWEEHDIKKISFDQQNFPDLKRLQVPSDFTLEVKKDRKPLLEKGTAVPMLRILDHSGKPINIQDMKGKLILLNVSWVGCPHCILSIEMLNKLNEKYTSGQLSIVSIYPLDKREDVKEMNERFGVKYSSYPHSSVTSKDLEAFHISAYPVFYLIDKQGAIIKGFAGYSSAIREELEGLIEKNL
ncbi:TlpA family protein disulfide reductase [Sphingobacterium lactis]|uniref:TlpA family protein disulfide reductase n=1 Tax=Sphingobacterium lactis TaxID=797291 RepID=UPI003F800E5E